jgi:hypothetical protein
MIFFRQPSHIAKMCLGIISFTSIIGESVGYFGKKDKYDYLCESWIHENNNKIE